MTPAAMANPADYARSAILNATMLPPPLPGAYSNSRVVLVGASMGAVAVLSHAATAHDLSGVVAVSSPGEWRLPLRIRSIATAGLARTRTGREFALRR